MGVLGNRKKLGKTDQEARMTQNEFDQIQMLQAEADRLTGKIYDLYVRHIGNDPIRADLTQAQKEAFVFFLRDNGCEAEGDTYAHWWGIK